MFSLVLKPLSNAISSETTNKTNPEKIFFRALKTDIFLPKKHIKIFSRKSDKNTKFTKIYEILRKSNKSLRKKIISRNFF